MKLFQRYDHKIGMLMQITAWVMYGDLCHSFGDSKGWYLQVKLPWAAMRNHYSLSTGEDQVGLCYPMLVIYKKPDVSPERYTVIWEPYE